MIVSISDLSIQNISKMATDKVATTTDIYNILVDIHNLILFCLYLAILIILTRLVKKWYKGVNA